MGWGWFAFVVLSVVVVGPALVLVAVAALTSELGDRRESTFLWTGIAVAAVVLIGGKELLRDRYFPVWVWPLAAIGALVLPLAAGALKSYISERRQRRFERRWRQR